MSKSKPKKAAPKKAAKKATPKAKPPTSSAREESVKAAPAKESTPKKKAAAADGVELARLRRLAKAGFEADRCALLGIDLDVGPRANRWWKPVKFGDEVVSTLAAAILDSGVPPEALSVGGFNLIERGES